MAVPISITICGHVYSLYSAPLTATTTRSLLVRCGVVQFDIKSGLHTGADNFDRLFNHFFCRTPAELCHLRNNGRDDTSFDLLHRNLIQFQYIFQVISRFHLVFVWFCGESFDKVCFFPLPHTQIRCSCCRCLLQGSWFRFLLFSVNYEMKFLWFYYTWCGALRQGKRQQEKDNSNT